jgi:hypothetical protein
MPPRASCIHNLTTFFFFSSSSFLQRQQLVKTKDRTLLGLHFTLLLMVSSFTFVSIIVLHNYMKVGLRSLPV